MDDLCGIPLLEPCFVRINLSERPALPRLSLIFTSQATFYEEPNLHYKLFAHPTL